MDWKDSTSYSRGDTARVPTTFTSKCGPLQLVVTKSHVHYPGRWVAHCHPLFETRPLEAHTREAAQDEVVRLAREWVNGS